MKIFHNPVNAYFGRGSLVLLEEIVNNKKIIVVISRRAKNSSESWLCKTLARSAEYIWVDDVKTNPEIEDIDKKYLELSDFDPDIILCIGGGSVIDYSKVLRKKYADADACNVIKSRVLKPQLIAIPTTGGSGSEVTQYAAIWDKVKRRKISYNSEMLFPDVAIIDPAFLDSLPIDIRKSSSLDALNQCFESLWSIYTNAVSEIYARRGVEIGIHSIPDYFTESSGAVCDDIALMSYFSGIAISQTRTGICHSISYPLTAHYNIPHGIACAFSMISVLRLSKQLLNSELIDSVRYNALRLIDIEKVRTIVELGDVYSIVRKSLGKKDNLLNLRSNMIDPKRANNSIVSADYLNQILEESWRGE